MTEPGSFDVAIVGAGPNGLTAAAYLARAGARVVLLEKRFERGGTFATDDYSTPFQYNLAQFELPLGEDLPPVSDLGLRAQAVRFVEPSLPFAARAETRGPELVIGRGGRGLGGGIEEMFAAVSEAVAPLLYGAPREEPQILAELESGGGLAAVALSEATPRSLAAGVEDSRAAVILRYACGLAGWLDADEPLGLVGAFCLARLFSPSIVAGGTKSLANAITRVAFSAGARGLLSSRVTRVEPAGEGFELHTADGRMTRATAVVSTLDPRSTFSGLLADDLVPDDLRAAVEAWRVEPTAAFTAHYGIKGAPPVPAGDGADALCRIFGFAGPEEVERHHAAALGGRLANRVAGHLTAVTAHDPLQASPGPFGPLHTLRLQTTVPFRHPAGPWDRERVNYRRECWDAAVASFDGLEQATLLFAFCDSPHDLERRFATTRGGSLRQGSLVRGQTLSGRPHPSCASGRTPIPGFYLGGGGVHPGVPVCLGGGYNAAGCVADDLGLERWWARPPAPELTARAAR